MATNRLMHRIQVGLAAACLVASLIAPSMAGAAQITKPVDLTIASFAQGSSWYVYAVNLAELLRFKLPKNSRIDTPPIVVGVGNPQLVAAGKVDLVFGMAVVGSSALEGKFAFNKKLS